MAPWDSEVAFSKVHGRPPNSRNPFPRLFLGREKPPSLHEGRLGAVGVDHRHSGHYVLTRDDGESRANLEIRTVHGSVRSIGTSKIIFTREDDQVHIGKYAQHVFTRED